LLAGEVVTLALSPANRRHLVAWLDDLPPPEGRVATVLGSLAAQMRPTLTKATPRALDTAPSQVDTPTTSVRPNIEPDTLRRINVELWLSVENNSTFVRGKTKTRAWIEDSVLRRYAMRKPGRDPERLYPYPHLWRRRGTGRHNRRHLVRSRPDR